VSKATAQTRRQPQGEGKTRDTGADDDDVVRQHGEMLGIGKERGPLAGNRLIHGGIV
jgi:hypothetical protein